MSGSQYLTNREVVDEGTGNASQQWRDNGNPGVGIEGTKAATSDCHPQARTKVTSRVDRISGIEAERSSNRNNQQADDQRIQVSLNRLITTINDSKDQPKQQSSAHELIAESPENTYKGFGTGIKDTTNLTHIVRVHRRPAQGIDKSSLVDKVENSSCDESTQHLRYPIGQDLAPGKSPGCSK